MPKSKSSLTKRILIGLVIGILAGAATLVLGHYIPPIIDWARLLSEYVLDPFGQVFLRLLFFVVIPLVFSSLASGVTQIGSLDRLGPLAGRTFTLFIFNMVVGVAIGLLMMSLINPGQHLAPETQAQLMQEYGATVGEEIAEQATTPKVNLMTIVDMFMPQNLIGAVAGHSDHSIGAVLPLILFAILIGAVGTKLEVKKRQKLQEALDLVTELMTGIVYFALKLAPYAVPALIYSVIVKVGGEILIALGIFTFGCILAMLMHMFVTLPLWLRFFTKRSPREFYRKVSPVLITAFSTSSSNATLPASLECAQKTLKVSPSVAGFVLPLGATMNMSGTALYEGCVVLFIAQIFGVELSLIQQATLLFLAVLSSVAVSGIPGGSLPLIAGILVSFGVPAEGIGIILGVDRLLDMMRTVVNVSFDLGTTVIVDSQVNFDELPATEGS